MVNDLEFSRNFLAPSPSYLWHTIPLSNILIIILIKLAETLVANCANKYQDNFIG